jgi:hypothetical protein
MNQRADSWKKNLETMVAKRRINPGGWLLSHTLRCSRRMNPQERNRKCRLRQSSRELCRTPTPHKPAFNLPVRRSSRRFRPMRACKAGTTVQRQAATIAQRNSATAAIERDRHARFRARLHRSSKRDTRNEIQQRSPSPSSVRARFAAG